MKKIRTLTIILLTVMALLTSCLTNVSAANVCKNIGGTANYQTTFTIKTSNSWLSSKKVTLKQTAQGTAKGRGWTSYKTKYYKIWGYYNVYVTERAGASSPVCGNHRHGRGAACGSCRGLLGQPG